LAAHRFGATPLTRALAWKILPRHHCRRAGGMTVRPATLLLGGPGRGSIRV
jgi:hypothetical protein